MCFQRRFWSWYSLQCLKTFPKRIHNWIRNQMSRKTTCEKPPFCFSALLNKAQKCPQEFTCEQLTLKKMHSCAFSPLTTNEDRNYLAWRSLLCKMKVNIHVIREPGHPDCCHPLAVYVPSLSFPEHVCRTESPKSVGLSGKNTYMLNQPDKICILSSSHLDFKLHRVPGRVTKPGYVCGVSRAVWAENGS